MVVINAPDESHEIESYLEQLGEMTADAAGIRWLLEELRIQVFAQPIGTKASVSIKKLTQRLSAVGA